MADLGRILVADDEETFRNSMADLLRWRGYQCDCASDASPLTKNNPFVLVRNDP